MKGFRFNKESQYSQSSLKIHGIYRSEWFIFWECLYSKEYKKARDKFLPTLFILAIWNGALLCNCQFLTKPNTDVCCDKLLNFAHSNPIKVFPNTKEVFSCNIHSTQTWMNAMLFISFRDLKCGDKLMFNILNHE